jgi:hypothetical protein
MLPQLSKQSDGKSQEASCLAALLSYCRSSEEHEKQRASENACPNQQDRKPKDIEFHGASLRPEADANLNAASVPFPARFFADEGDWTTAEPRPGTR